MKRMKSLTLEYAKYDRPIAAVVLSSGEERYSAYSSVVTQDVWFGLWRGEERGSKTLDVRKWLRASYCYQL